MPLFPTLVTSALCLCLSLCQLSCTRPAPTGELVTTSLTSNSQLASDPFNQRISSILAHAQHVEARRINETFHKGPPIKREETLGPPTILNADVSARLSTLLLDRHSYTNMMVLCFQPGVQFEFASPQGRAIVRVCFHCQNLTANLVEATGAQSSREINFSPAFARFIGIAQEIFPTDPDIQSLKESDAFIPPN